MNNISLIGMPGAGKSTIGVLLAKTLGFPFIDTDLIIQENEGRLLQDILENSGSEAFLRIEEQVLVNLSSEKSVIATGGSAVYSQKGMANLKKLGQVIYLKQSYDEIYTRLSNIKTRGVVMSGGKTLSDIYEERTILYEKYADITIDCLGKTSEEVVECIKKSAEHNFL